MLDRTDFHRNLVAVNRVNGDVFFYRRIGRAGNEFLHGRSAADRGNRRFLDHGNDFPASIALEKFHGFLLVFAEGNLPSAVA
jgi:hypothetical protein